MRPTKKHSVWSAGSNPAVHRVLVVVHVCTCTCAQRPVCYVGRAGSNRLWIVLVCRDFTTTCTSTCARRPVFDLYLYFTPCPGERSSNRYIYFVITSPAYYKIFLYFCKNRSILIRTDFPWRWCKIYLFCNNLPWILYFIKTEAKTNKDYRQCQVVSKYFILFLLVYV